MIDYKTIGNKIRTRRTACNLSQENWQKYVMSVQLTFSI